MKTVVMMSKSTAMDDAVVDFVEKLRKEDGKGSIECTDKLPF